MVNYARMEEVWRSYGPLEPVGPERTGRWSRRRVAVVAAGVAGVCALGAGAGLYLQPNLDRGAPEPPAASARAESSADASSASGSPVGPSEAALTEAAALEAQLQLAVADSVIPVSSGSGYGAPASGSELATQVPMAAPPVNTVRPVPLPPPTQVGTPARSTPPALTRILPPPARPRVGPPARPAVVRPTASPEQPLVVASADPPARSYPRYAPPVRRAPPPPLSLPPAPTPPATASVSAPPPAPEGPSFDCARARSAADRMVCESPDLAALDRRMDAELAGAVAAGHSRTLLLRDQNDWRARRDAAAPDPRAVADAYRRRIGQLRSMQ